MNLGKRREKMSNGFDVSKIIEDEEGNPRANKIEELINAPRNAIIQFLERCDKEIKIDMNIFASWEKHFKIKEVPYAVVRIGMNHLTIIKIRMADY